MKSFATIVGPLHALMKKDVVFHWTPEWQEAFLKLKHLLMIAPITAFPDFTMPFRLYTDASTLGLGAILAQVQDGKERFICCASHALLHIERNYPATKLEYLAIVWATVKLHAYLMLNKFDIYTDHYALQWLKSMRTRSALLHRWSAALKELNFTIHQCPGKDQGHVDGLSHLPVEDASPDGEEAALLVQNLSSEEAARQAAQELHRGTYVEADVLCKLFRDSFSYTGGKRICLETARCQAGTNHRATWKTTGTIMSVEPWDSLSVDNMGPLLLIATQRMQY